jgi:hypothetical protein
LASVENVGGGNLASPQENVGKDTLPSLPPIVVAAATVVAAAATAEVQIEEGEIVVKASQETAEPSSQRFVAETPPGTTGDVGGTLHVASPPQIVLQDTDLGGGPMETDAPRVKAHKGKGTTTITLDFDDSDDDIFDEEVENSRASHLSESTIDVNTGEKVAYPLEKGVSTGKFFLFVSVFFYFDYLLTFDLSVLCRGIFLGLFVSKRDNCGCWENERGGLGACYSSRSFRYYT